MTYISNLIDGLVAPVVARGRTRRRAFEPRAGHRTSTGRVAVTSAPALGREDTMFFSPSVLTRIRSTIGSVPAEQGGVLGFDRASGVITEFELDERAERTGATYSPDVPFVNDLLKRWNAAGIRLAGFVHSHPRGATRPSHGDAVYAARLLELIPDLDRLALPIVQSADERGGFEIRAYYAVRQDAAAAAIVPAEVRIGDSFPVVAPHYERVSQAVDIKWLSRTRVVVVGAGGSASFCRDLARLGVGQIVLVDPDVVEAPNVGTQDVDVRDLGRPKVDALASRVVDASAHARVLGVVGRFEDIEPAMLGRLLTGGLPGLAAGPPRHTLLCGFTDDFYAQAYVNRVALQFGVPMLAAQLYRGGSVLELSFAAPGVSRACGRCVLGGRYRMYRDGFVNDVGSGGTPYSATAHVNALKQDLALALLQGSPTLDSDDDVTDGVSHAARVAARDYLGAVGRRNLVQVRRDPLVHEHLGLGVFERVFEHADRDRLFAGEPVWLPQEPEHPDHGFEACPDCGGHGDLRAVRGSFDDLHRLDWVLTPRRRREIDARVAHARAIER